LFFSTTNIPKLATSAFISYFSARTYHRDDSSGDVLELDTTLVKGSHQQLPVFSRVFVFYVVGFDHFFLQH
jgi:hypothetical protein